MIPDYYKLLGIDSSATPPEITSAFRALAMKLHPDRNPAPDAKERFIEVREAFDILIDASEAGAHTTN